MKSTYPVKIKYSFLPILTGSDLSHRRLALIEAEAKETGPVIWLTACIHGDEVGGIIVIQEVLKKIQKYGLKKGTVSAFPLMNPIGFETASRNVTLSEEDLNRVFPGDSKGSIAERMAHLIYSTIIKTKPTVVFDLHNDYNDSIPYALIDSYPGQRHKAAYQRARELAGESGLLLVNEQMQDTPPQIAKSSLSGSMLYSDIPSITLELGGTYIVDEKMVKIGTQAIWNILTHFGMVDPLPESAKVSQDFGLAKSHLKYSNEPVSSTSGIIRFLVKPGDIVKRKQAVARIYNVYGRLQETIFALNDGIVLGHSDYAVAFPGGEVIAFGIF